MSFTKMNSKWIMDLMVKHETEKFRRQQKKNLLDLTVMMNCLADELPDVFSTKNIIHKSKN